MSIYLVTELVCDGDEFGLTCDAQMRLDGWNRKGQRPSISRLREVAAGRYGWVKTYHQGELKDLCPFCSRAVRP